jgi:DNA-binding beta-propeller fold protein YncE
MGASAARRPAWNEPGVRLVWPPPPERARIEYVGAIRSGEDLGRENGWVERLKSVVFGREPMEMVKPTAVAKNEAGLLAVTDTSVPTVHFFDLVQRKYWRLDDDLASLLRSPVGVAVDRTGRVYVADSVQGRIFVFAEGRRLAAEIGLGVLERPTGLALDPSGERLYAVDTLRCRVVVFLLDGRQVGEFGNRGAGPGEFNAPTHIVVSRQGRISVSDSLNFRVQTFDSAGTPVAAFGEPGDAAGMFSRPKGVGADTSGRLYIVDAGFENVQIFDPDGTLLLAFGGPGIGAGEFYLPSGLFLDSSNTIWVADSFNKRVQVFRFIGGE